MAHRSSCCLLPAAQEDEPDAPVAVEQEDEADAPVAVEQEDEPAAPDATVAAEGMPAGIYAGTCVESDLLEPVVVLNGPRVAKGTALGAADALPVGTAYTIVDVAFDDMLNGTQVVAVYDEDDPETMVACGAIGGVLDANGALSIGLAPVGDSGLAGVAYLSSQPNGTSTGISLFIVEGLP